MRVRVTTIYQRVLRDRFELLPPALSAAAAPRAA